MITNNSLKVTMQKKTYTFQVSGIVDQIIKYGKVTRPVLGISFAPEQSVEQLGVSGVLVLDAPPSGPAGKAVWIFLVLPLAWINAYENLVKIPAFTVSMHRYRGEFT